MTDQMISETKIAEARKEIDEAIEGAILRRDENQQWLQDHNSTPMSDGERNEASRRLIKSYQEIDRLRSMDAVAWHFEQQATRAFEEHDAALEAIQREADAYAPDDDVVIVTVDGDVWGIERAILDAIKDEAAAFDPIRIGDVAAARAHITRIHEAQAAEDAIRQGVEGDPRRDEDNYIDGVYYPPTRPDLEQIQREADNYCPTEAMDGGDYYPGSDDDLEYGPDSDPADPTVMVVPTNLGGGEVEYWGILASILDQLAQDAADEYAAAGLKSREATKVAAVAARFVESLLNS